MFILVLIYSTIFLHYHSLVWCRRVIIIQQQVNLVTQCARLHKASKGDVASFKKKEIPTTDAGKCMLACVLDRKGVMKKGKFNSKNSVTIAQKAYPKDMDKINKVIEILDSCGSKVNTEKNKCEVAYQLAHCTTTLSEKIKLI